MEHSRALLENFLLLNQRDLGTPIDHLDYARLQQAMLGLKKASEIFRESRAIYDGEIEEIERAIKKFIDRIEFYLSEIKWNIYDVARESTRLLIVMNQLKGFSEIETILLGVSGKSFGLLSSFNQQANAVLKAIEDEFLEPALLAKGELLISSFDFLTACQHSDEIVLSQRAHAMTTDCQTRINKWIVEIKGKLEEKFSILMLTDETQESNAKKATQDILRRLLSFHKLQSLCDERRRNLCVALPYSFETLINEVWMDWFAVSTGKVYQNLQDLFTAAERIRSGVFDKQIYLKIEIAMELRELDKFIKGEKNYSSMQAQLQSAIKSHQDNQLSSLKISAINKKYPAFFSMYLELWETHPELNTKQHGILNEIFESINVEITVLMAELDKMQFEYYTPDRLKTFLQRVSAMNNAQILSSLPGVTGENRFETAMNRVTNGFIKKINVFFVLIDRDLDETNLKSALKKIQHVKLVAELFVVSTVVAEEKSAVKNRKQLAQAGLEGGELYDLIAQQIIRVDQRSKKIVNEKSEYYSKLEIEKYAQFPPREHFALLDVLNNEDSAFSELHTQLHDQIIAKIKRLVRECKKEEVDFDIDERIKLLKNLHPFIPVTIYSAYESDLREAEAHLEARRDKQKRLQIQLEHANDLIGLVDALMTSHEVWHMKQLSDSIALLMGSAFQDYKKAIDAGNLADILAPLNNAWFGWKYYYLQLKNRTIIMTTENSGYIYGKYTTTRKMHLEDILNPDIPNKQCLDIITLVSNSFNQSLDSLVKEVNQGNKKALRTITQHLPSIKSFFQLYANFEEFQRTGRRSSPHCDAHHLWESLSKRNDRVHLDQLKSTMTQIKDFFVFIQVAFDKAMTSNELDKLASIMDMMESEGVILEKVIELVKEPFVSHHLRGCSIELESCLTYNTMRTALATKIIALRDTASQKILEHKRAKSSNSYDRKEFYREISSAFSALKIAKALVRHVDERIANVNSLGDEAHNAISLHLTEVADAVEQAISRIPCSEEKNYSELNTWYDNLRLAVECFEVHGLAQDAAQMLVKLERNLTKKIDEYKILASQASDNPALIQYLLQLKLMSIHAPTFKSMADKVIDDLLKAIKKERGGAQRIATIGIELNQRDDECQALAQMLIAEHDAFKSYAIELRNEKTLRFGLDYVLEKIEKNRANTDLHVDQLTAFYAAYTSIYWNLVESGLLQIESALKSIVQAVKVIVGSGEPHQQKVIQLMAHLFAYWTLMNAEERAAAAEEESSKNYLLQPHAAQVVSIFRLLGLDASDRDYLKNHLVEIGTGEGKSVTMAVTASVLALLGYDVDCACYSEYLSQRDYEDFIGLFSAFGLRRHITYGTFNRLCENLINQRGDVRQVVIDVIKGGSEAQIVATGSGRERIIIIDEVDVFFSQDFYGNFYRPLAEIRDPAAHALLSYIWAIRKDKTALRLNNVKLSKPYLDCAIRFSGWESLLEESLKAMIVDVQTFDGQEYVVVNDKIGYREQHGVSFDISYRYKTIFAYFCEHEKGEITSSSRDLRVALLIDCGAFSYAEIPKKYKSVMGVTGTLSTLSPPERNLLESIYRIKKFSYMPSVYGENQLDFSSNSIKGVIISERAAYFMEITNEIKRRRLGDSIIERPVMVFFPSNEQLTSYYNSSELGRSGIEREKIKLITEELPDDQKPGLIRQAASEGAVTLLTRGFGRGTDFKCFDDRINKRCGGVHVVQTFVSDEISEETQIKGRTARQGEPGSYSMVLAAEDLERYNLREREIARMKSTSELYTTLNEARCRFFHEKYSESLRYVDEIKQDHDAAMIFLSALFNKRIDEVREFLKKRNETLLAASGSARTICLMDATGSMSHLIAKAKNTVATMFQQACDVLSMKGMQSGFELQFVVYRNYNCDATDLLEHSAWESDPNNLRKFLESITPKGGMGNEAIEIGFCYANQLADSSQVDQIILIGDMPPNSVSEVTRNRSSQKGEAYWKDTVYANPTHYELELEKLCEREIPIPVHAFYVKDDARIVFQQIATKSGGQSEALDINSPAGAERLTQLVTERILENIGGSSLVEAYREKYVKGYVSSIAKVGMFSQSGVTGSSLTPNLTSPDLL